MGEGRIAGTVAFITGLRAKFKVARYATTTWGRRGRMLFRLNLERPTLDGAVPAFRTVSMLSVPWVEPIDVSNAVLLLTSNEPVRQLDRAPGGCRLV
jgi:hypothetical protein